MDTSECRKMQLWCLQRAKEEPGQSWKWLGQAERWRALARSQPQQGQFAGPMSMGPLTVIRDTGVLSVDMRIDSRSDRTMPGIIDDTQGGGIE